MWPRHLDGHKVFFIAPSLVHSEVVQLEGNVIKDLVLNTTSDKSYSVSQVINDHKLNHQK